MVYVIGGVEGRAEGEQQFVAESGETARIQFTEYEGRSVMPIFTAPERVAEYAGAGTHYIGATLQSLLEMTGPCEMFMNPGSAYGKHFLADEVGRLLDGSAFRPAQSWVASGGETMIIGQPAAVPQEFLEKVKTMLARRNNVRRAWLAMMHIPSRGEQPNLLLAIDCEGDVAPIAADCGIIAASMLPGGVVDIATPSIAPSYFAKAAAFYDSSADTTSL